MNARYDQRATNNAIWAGLGFWGVRVYARSRQLRPAEAVVLDEHKGALSGRILELGCGAGRVTRHLVELGSRVHGLDISPAMVRHCRKAFPGASFSLGDMRDLSTFGASTFDAVVAAYNVLDVFDDLDRRATLEEIRRVLTPGGLLILSAHNLAWADAGNIGGPTTIRRDDPLRFAYDALRVPLRLRNHRRTRSFERRGRDHALLADVGFNFGVLHYYIGRDAQVAQLEQAGFAVIGCYDHEGRPVPPGAEAKDSADIHYVARLAGGMPS